MPKIKSAIKELRKAKKREIKNKKVKDGLKYLERNFLKAVKGKEKDKAKEFFLKIQKALDKAAKQKIIKKNKAGRKKSRLAKKLNLLSKS